jgi:hypothetical protein
LTDLPHTVTVPGFGEKQTVQVAQQRGLAGAIGTGDDGEFTLVEGEGDIVEPCVPSAKR